MSDIDPEKARNLLRRLGDHLAAETTVTGKTTLHILSTADLTEAYDLIEIMAARLGLLDAPQKEGKE